MNEWVDVSERLPEEGKTVVVYGSHAVYACGGKHYANTIATGTYRYGVWAVYYPISFNVIAWMDPGIPKGGE